MLEAVECRSAEPILAVDGVMGRYIPWYFCQDYALEMDACGLACEQADILGWFADYSAGYPTDPEDLDWAWQTVLDKFVMSYNGVDYTLYECSEGLYLIPDGFDIIGWD